MEATTATKRTPKVDPDSIETEWFAWISYGEPTNPDRSSCSAAGANLSEFIASVMRTASYYLAMGYVVNMRRAHRGCCRCHGDGTVFTKPYRPRKRCPDCKGIGVFQSLPDIRLNVSENVVLRAPWMEPAPISGGAPDESDDESEQGYWRIETRHGVAYVDADLVPAIEPTPADLLPHMPPGHQLPDPESGDPADAWSYEYFDGPIPDSEESAS